MQRGARSTLGENFLRFGRSEQGYGLLDKDYSYLRFGKRSLPALLGFHSRKRREAETEDQVKVDKRSADSTFQAKEKKSHVWFGEQDDGDMKRGLDEIANGGDKRFMRFGRNNDELGNGWLHFGKRSAK